MQVLTIATMSTLPRARALVRSLARHQPDWPASVTLIAHDAAIAEAAAAEPGLAIRSVAEQLDVDVEALLARHGEEDLTMLLMARVLRAQIDGAAEPVLHLPNTAWALADLDPLAQALERRGAVLFARVSGELPDDGLEPNRAQLDRAGRIDDTMMAVDGSERSRELLAWWSERVEATLGSIDALRVGARPEDRPWLARFLELAPARFGVPVLDAAEYDLSMWNIDRHRLEPSGEQVFVDRERPLRLMNLPGFDPDRPYRLAAGASRARVSRAPALRSLCERYGAELRAAGWNDAEHRHDVGRRLAGELVYDDALRAIYARALALGAGVEDLFGEDGSRAFLAWLAQPAPRGGAYGINRYVFYRVSRERPDVLRKYPDVDGEDGPGYVEWCWAFGREELGIPDRFMPLRARSRARAGAAEPVAGDPAALAPAVAQAPQARADPPVPVTSELVPNAIVPGVPNDDLAVRVTGYLGHTLGLGAAARGYVRALSAAAVPVSTVSVPLHHLALPVRLADAYGRHGFEDLVRHGGHGFEIVAVNADELPDFVRRLGEDYFEGPRIGIWGWETNSIPARWARAFALVQEIWVYSRFMAENIGAATSVPVRALPPPVERPREPAEPLRLGVGDGFLFLFVFDYLSTVQRKNPVGLVEAFKRAFAPGEGPRLLIKTINAPLRPLSEEEVLWAVQGRNDIHVLDRSLSPHELDGLMAACDCYVSLHRAEGFGLTLAEAMAIGKPTIATGYSGNVDFMDERNSYLVDYTIGRVGPECEIYPPEGEWAEPSVEHAAALMRRVYEQPEEARIRGEQAARDVQRTLSREATGAAMRARLQQLARDRPGRVARRVR
jgi:glycosyltransferase involved in cell wall biosynthesis